MKGQTQTHRMEDVEHLAAVRQSVLWTQSLHTSIDKRSHDCHVTLEEAWPPPDYKEEANGRAESKQVLSLEVELGEEDVRLACPRLSPLKLDSL